NRINNIKLTITQDTGSYYKEILEYRNDYNPTVPDENNLADWQAFYDKQIEGINGNPATGLDSPLMTAANRMRDYKGYLTAFNDLYGYFCQQYQNYKDIFEDTYSETNPDTWEDILNSDEYYITYTKVKLMLDKVKSYISSNSCASIYDSFGGSISSEARYISKASAISSHVADKFKAFYSSTKVLCDALFNAIDNLTVVHSRAIGVQNSAKRLKDTEVEAIQDDSTKSQINSDIDALAKSVDYKEVGALKELLEKYQERFKGVLDNLKTVKYLDTELYNYSGSYSVFRDKEQLSGTAEGKSGEDLCSDFIKDNPERHEGYDNIIETDKLKPALSEEAKKIKGNNDEEIFYNVMRNTEDAKDNKPKEESGGQLETTLIEAKNNSKVNANGTNDKDVSGNVDSQSATEAPKPEGDYEGGKESEFKDAVKEINATSTIDIKKVDTNGVSVPEGEDDNPKDRASEGKNQLAKANDLLQSIANLGNNLKNNVYLEEYFTEMFTCQTDKKIAESELILLNGYSNNPGATKYINPKNDWYGKEIEYILWGNDSLQENLTTTETTIFLLRFAINAIYAFTASDIQAMANSIATLLVGWTVVLVPVVQVCIILALALAESALDLQMLKDGRDVPLIKDGATFICSPQGAINKGVEYG
ncbi:MAG: hypothetical protein K2G25_02915, partial [Oscillospiraceae bacterium]|nr:hypothetical protein [Oscillospiraceae bacterium]